MKIQLLLLVAVVAILVADVQSEKMRKLKKFRRRPPPTTTTESETIASGEDEFSMMEQDDKEEARKQEIPEEPREEEIKTNDVPINDLCAKKHCGAGRVCDINDNGEPECICIPTCPEEVDPRRKVCSNHNETWTSDCAVYQMRCWCERGLDRCKGETFKHVHIEYYGVCREMPACTDTEMGDFPRRMRDWLFNIMRDLADRQELTPYYLKLEREAETNMTRRWSNAAVWKWCDLDGHPHDRSVSRHELFPIRAPLMSLEHCIAPFLDGCDADDNHKISLTEWGKCLQLDEDIFEAECEDLRRDEE